MMDMVLILALNWACSNILKSENFLSLITDLLYQHFEDCQEDKKEKV
jgi:hypothetical protein